jgi:hypothetical protein
MGRITLGRLDAEPIRERSRPMGMRPDIRVARAGAWYLLIAAMCAIVAVALGRGRADL